MDNTSPFIPPLHFNYLTVDKSKIINILLLFISPINEFVQPILQFFDLEPVGVEWHHVWCPVLIIIPVEVFTKPFKNFCSIVTVQHTLIQIRTMTTFVSFHIMSIQRNFPCTYYPKIMDLNYSKQKKYLQIILFLSIFLMKFTFKRFSRASS